MDVITIGETVVLLTPDIDGPIRYAKEFSRTFDGAESNLAIGLTRLGHKAAWMSRLGNDEFGRAMLTFIRGEGVDVSRVKTDANRPTGLLFEEKRREVDYRVYPYYSHSAASRWGKEDIDMDYLAKAKYIYLTGLMPITNEESFEATLEIIETAKANQVTFIFDLNTRRNNRLKAEERELLFKLSALADYLLVDRNDVEILLKVTEPKQIAELFLQMGVKNILFNNNLKGLHYFTRDEEYFFEPSYIGKVERNFAGVGDGFATGFISGLIDNVGIHESIKRGEAIAWLVNTGNGVKEDLPNRVELMKLSNV